ncbi:ATP-binding cassette domain-containing protein (plasmid) [Agrobacterium sp. MA01]|uniref:ATP-binding cassette domain-containing protein n=1 Tax=Agrobacterium sp. MA01 TaxID=2664893 RepID=UPI00129C05EE|nr:excinuclease ABC subunit UvrA [Agrobacterium sp. MA01]QGG93281.1 ATP-binding cassette domain-containing protein [Agrobacterium sp. MA01]
MVIESDEPRQPVSVSLPVNGEQGAPAREHYIRITGARTNNLKGISIDIPKRKITVFSGVSGSGKSSLVFGTIAAESQRLVNETYPVFVQQFMPRYGEPDADSLENLSAAIIVDQQRLSGDSRSTVATVTDTAQMLRLLFSRHAEPRLGPPGAYSFNDPRGLCTNCQGVGQVATINMSAVMDVRLSLSQGALLPKEFAINSWWWDLYRNSGLFDMDKPVNQFTEEEMHTLLHLDDGRKVKVGKVHLTYQGVLIKLMRGLGAKDPDLLQPHMRVEYDRIFTRGKCSVCAGTRLNAAALRSRLGRYNIAELMAMQVSDLIEIVRAFDMKEAKPLLQALIARLQNLVTIGLGYLNLDRESATLSGGESQRVKMVRHLGSSLSDITYVFDEPSVGLHPHDVGQLARLMLQLRDKDNTVLVVEHKPDMIMIADHVVDIGPLAGTNGGEVVYQGNYAGLLRSGTSTGRYLTQPHSIRATHRERTGSLRIEGARINNLRDVSVDIPKGVMTVVTGVAGSGKSSLVRRCLPQHYPEAVIIDQNLARGSRRSNAATYTGVLDGIRKAFANANGVAAGLFSANSKGACPECNGLGLIFTDLGHLDPMVTTCEACDGKRFLPEVLEHRLRGKSIADIYDMNIETAAAFFTESGVVLTLQRLAEVGLGYLTLGQPLSTLSGGERQRLKLAGELGTTGNIYVLDEPTSGLHPHDVRTLIGILDRLVEAESTVIVIEHNLDVIARADWIIDLGPGAGCKGGRLIFEGPPSELARCTSSLTGLHFNKYLHRSGGSL